MSELTQHERLEKTEMTAIKWAIGILIVGIGWAFVVANGANTNSQEALNGVADVKGDIKSIKVSLENVNKNLDNINSYFKLTPRDVIQKQINFNVGK